MSYEANRLKIASNLSDVASASAAAHSLGLGTADSPTFASVTANGSALTALNGSQVTTGTVADARLSANVALLNAANTFTLGQTVSAVGSTTAAPAILGFNNLNITGQACRFQFGDSANCINTSYGGRTFVNSFWGFQISGNRESGVIPADFIAGAVTDPSLTVIGTQTAAPVIHIQAPSGQTGNLIEAMVNGSLVAAIDAHGRSISAGATPSVALGTGAGTTPGAVTIVGNDTAGSISFATGTAPAASATIFILTFANAYVAAPKTVIVTPGNGATLAAIASFYHNQGSLLAASFVLSSWTAPLPASTALVFCYRVEG